MTYSSRSDVKTVLQISESVDDTEIDGCIASSDAIIDSILLREGLSLATPTPQNIKDASAHYAAWLFRRRNDPVGAEAFRAEAERFLALYVEARRDPGFRVVNDA